MKNHNPTSSESTLTKLNTAYILSIIIFIISATVAIFGLVYPEKIYKTKEVINLQVPNDIASLSFVLPIFFICGLFSFKGVTLGTIFWLGAVFNFAYFYTVSVFDIPFGLVIIANLLIVLLSMFTLSLIITSLDFKSIQIKYEPIIPRKTIGGILLGLAIFNILHQFGDIVSVVTGINEKTSSSTALLYVDIVYVIPLLIASGLSIIRKKAFGYVIGGAILFNYLFMCLALLVFFIIEPNYAGKEFNLVGFIVISVMVLVCFYPLFFYFKGGIGKKEKV